MKIKSPKAHFINQYKSFHHMIIMHVSLFLYTNQLLKKCLNVFILVIELVPGIIQYRWNVSIGDTVAVELEQDSQSINQKRRILSI